MDQLTLKVNNTWCAAGPGHELYIDFDSIPDEVQEGGMLHGEHEAVIKKVDRQKMRITMYPSDKTVTLSVSHGSPLHYSSPLFSLPDVVDFDIESTGVDTMKDRIVELAMVKWRNRRIIDEFSLQINPQMPIPVAATEIHKITDENVKDCPIFKDIAGMVHAFILDCDLSGFNIMGFDVPMLYNEFERAGIAWDYKKHEYIDVFRAYKSVYPDNLMGAYKRLFGEEFDAAHSATADIKAARRILDILQIAKTREEFTRLSNYDSPLLDLNRKFAYKDGEIIINFGNKCKGELASKNHEYVKWMLEKGDFSSDVKLICKQILNIK